MKSGNNWLKGAMAFLLVAAFVSACAKATPGLYETPEAAIQALGELIGSHDNERVEAMFGPGSVDLFSSGDEAADRADFDRVKAMILEKVEFEEFDENTRIALLGEQAWSFPIPLKRDGEGWRFDTATGREELLNRRIGANELWTLTALHEVVDAQREYASHGRDGNPPAYAQRFRSTEGKQDGLYWPDVEGADPSPLGDLLAESESWGSEPRPFHGYFYRMLTSAGPSAPGGARNYLDANGLLTGGFAVIAWPAKHGNSGVMTFITSNRGITYQKDLGAETEQVVAAIQSFDPDASWTPTGDTMLNAEPEE